VELSYQTLSSFVSATLMLVVDMNAALSAATSLALPQVYNDNSSSDVNDGDSDDVGKMGETKQQQQQQQRRDSTTVASLQRFLHFCASCFSVSQSRRVLRHVGERVPSGVSLQDRCVTQPQRQEAGAARHPRRRQLGGGAAPTMTMLPHRCWPSPLDVIHHLALAWIGQVAPSLAVQLHTFIIHNSPSRVLDEWRCVERAKREQGTPSPPSCNRYGADETPVAVVAARHGVVQRAAVFDAISAFTHGVAQRWHRWSSSPVGSTSPSPSLWCGSSLVQQPPMNGVCCRANAVQWCVAMTYTALQSLMFVLSADCHCSGDHRHRRAASTPPDAPLTKTTPVDAHRHMGAVSEAARVADVVEDVTAIMEVLSIIPAILRACLSSTEVGDALIHRKDELLASSRTGALANDDADADDGASRCSVCSAVVGQQHARSLFRLLLAVFVFLSSSTTEGADQVPPCVVAEATLVACWQKWLLPLLLHEWWVGRAVAAPSAEVVQLSVLTTAERLLSYGLALLHVIREELHAMARSVLPKCRDDGRRSALSRSNTATNTTVGCATADAALKPAASRDSVSFRVSNGVPLCHAADGGSPALEVAPTVWPCCADSGEQQQQQQQQPWALPSTPLGATTSWQVACRYAVQQWLHLDSARELSSSAAPPSVGTAAVTTTVMTALHVLHRHDLRRLRGFLLTLHHWVVVQQQQQLQTMAHRRHHGSDAAEGKSVLPCGELLDDPADAAPLSASCLSSCAVAVLYGAAVSVTEALTDDDDDDSAPSSDSLMIAPTQDLTSGPLQGCRGCTAASCRTPSTVSSFSSSPSSTPSLGRRLCGGGEVGTVSLSHDLLP